LRQNWRISPLTANNAVGDGIGKFLETLSRQHLPQSDCGSVSRDSDKAPRPVNETLTSNAATISPPRATASGGPQGLEATPTAWLLREVICPEIPAK
jgi:hypothetical protein